MNHLLKGLVVVLAVFLFVGCSKKVKPDEGTDVVVAAPGQDTAIASQDMSMAADGSDSGKIAGLYSIHFDYDRSSLSPEARDLVQKNAEFLKGHPGVALQIEGHCDRHGSIEYNLALGERRANTVKKYMMDLGVSEKELSTISYGKEKLLDAVENDAADAKNRRANFKAVASGNVGPTKL